MANNTQTIKLSFLEKNIKEYKALQAQLKLSSLDNQISKILQELELLKSMINETLRLLNE